MPFTIDNDLSTTFGFAAGAQSDSLSIWLRSPSGVETRYDLPNAAIVDLGVSPTTGEYEYQFNWYGDASGRWYLRCTGVRGGVDRTIETYVDVDRTVVVAA